MWVSALTVSKKVVHWTKQLRIALNDNNFFNVLPKLIKKRQRKRGKKLHMKKF